MTIDLPFWVRQRQAKLEELAIGTYRLSGPNLPEAVVSVQIEDSLRWRSRLQGKVDGPIIATTPAEFENPRDALAAGFELYRNHCVV